jgi:hypothetical protein
MLTFRNFMKSAAKSRRSCRVADRAEGAGRRRPRFEQLEDRQMLSVGGLLPLFAEFAGTLDQAGGVEKIPICIAPEKLGINGGKAVLGFKAQ